MTPFRPTAPACRSAASFQTRSAASFHARPALGLAAFLAAATPALSPAQAHEEAAPAEKPTGLWERDTLTGDWGGLRSRLADAGISLGAIEISELLGNVSGGVRQGFDYMGRTELDLDVDLEKLAGWQGGLIHAHAFQIHGRGLSANNLGGNYLGPSNIEALRTTRLFDAWFQQNFFDDVLSVRIGQIAGDDEFITSQYAGTFINSTFGWPGMMAANLPSGGPAFPLATPGIRVKVTPLEGLSWQTAVFNGNPAGTVGDPNPQIRDRSGTNFNLDSDAFAMTELAYAVTGALPATYKLGAWYHSGKFADLRYGRDGLSLASAAGSGVARLHPDNFGLYGVVDQYLWRREGAEDQGLAAFLRAGGAPDDRNALSLYADFGVNLRGTFEGRDSDILGLAFSIGKISDSLSALDRDVRAANGGHGLIRDYEAAVELTYQYAVAPWWVVQPDFQYIIHPAGTVADPNSPSGQPIGDAAIVGVRTTVKF